MVRAYTSTAKDTQQDKPNKKTKGGQKLTWHQFITRELNTIGIDLQKAIKLSKDRDLYNQVVVARVMAKAVNNNYLPEDGEPLTSGTLPGQRLAKAVKDAQKTTIRTWPLSES